LEVYPHIHFVVQFCGHNYFHISHAIGIKPDTCTHVIYMKCRSMWKTRFITPIIITELCALEHFVEAAAGLYLVTCDDQALVADKKYLITKTIINYISPLLYELKLNLFWIFKSCTIKELYYFQIVSMTFQSYICNLS